jgi:hypothetical protein
MEHAFRLSYRPDRRRQHGDGLMGALTLVPSNGLPPARARLVNLTRRISDAEKRLRTLQDGKNQLAAELGRAAGAKAELQELVNFDAVRLVDRLRDGGQWLLSSFGNARARELAASLSESRIQAAVGETALASVTGEIAALEREVADLKAAKSEAVTAVLIEAADGFRADLLIAIDDLRQAMTILAGLDRVTARGDGSWSPRERIAVEIPALGTLPAQVCVAPHSMVDKAQSTLLAFAAELDSNPLADIENLKFQHVAGNEDSGKTTYAEFTSAERQMIDLERASGVK